MEGPEMGPLSDIDTRIKQIAHARSTRRQPSPRNIRSASKDAVEKWLLNASKDTDVRLGMTASILDEIFNDPNPRPYGPLCLQLQTALEEM